MACNFYFEEHGGGCCGIRNIYGLHDDEEEFEPGDVKRIKDRINGHFSNLDLTSGGSGEGLLFEIVVTDRQLEDSEHLEDGLKKLGFKLVNEFINRNSGNTCYIYHLFVDNNLGLQ